MNVNTRTDTTRSRLASEALKRINERNARDVKRLAKKQESIAIKKSKIYEFDITMIQDSKGNNRVQVWIARDGGADRGYTPRAKSVKRIESLYQSRQYNPRIEFNTYVGSNDYHESSVWIKLLQNNRSFDCLC